MAVHNDVPPRTLGVELREEGVVVTYADGRTTIYRGVPQKVSGSLKTAPGKETHILVTDPTETEGVLLYVNDLKTADEILEDTGVGRILLSEGDREDVFPGVTVSSTSWATAMAPVSGSESASSGTKSRRRWPTVDRPALSRRRQRAVASQRRCGGSGRHRRLTPNSSSKTTAELRFGLRVS